MAKLQWIEGQIELKCDADNYFDAWACKPHQTPKKCPNKITKVELQEGEWHKVGAVLDWTYCFQECGVGEKTFSITTRVEELDAEKRILRHSYPSGFIIEKYYKSFRTKMEVTPKCETQGCIVKCTIEYEKLNEDAPDANIYLEFLLGVAKDSDF